MVVEKQRQCLPTLWWSLLGILWRNLLAAFATDHSSLLQLGHYGGRSGHQHFLFSNWLTSLSPTLILFLFVHFFLTSKYILDQGIAVKDRQERVLALLCWFSISSRGDSCPLFQQVCIRPGTFCQLFVSCALFYCRTKCLFIFSNILLRWPCGPLIMKIASTEKLLWKL